MNHWITSHLDYFFRHYGYWSIFLGVLLEDAGIPFPGETILIAGSLFARTQHEMNFVWIGVVAATAAIAGDNLGFLAGHYGGRRLLKKYRRVLHIKTEWVHKGERLFARHGKLTVFLARFITGLRVIAGPLAGVLRMQWKSFVVFNGLGALCWVALIVGLAYLLGPDLKPLIDHASWVILGFVVAAIAYWWFKLRRSS